MTLACKDKMKALWLLVSLVLLARCQALADGKLYGRDRVPPEIPYQRAIIFFSENRETLLIQSRVGGAPNLVDETLGWVIPCPSVPELSTMSVHDSENLFRILSFLSRPYVVDMKQVFLAGSVIVAWVGLVCWALGAMRSGRLTLGKAATSLMLFFVAVILSIGLFGRSISATFHGITVLRNEAVGIYDVQVVRAEEGAGLISWLQEGGFQFEASDRIVLDEYIRAGWCFVAGVLRPGETPGLKRGLDGLLDPIILRFSSPEPVYPLKLTGTVGADTEVVIYVVAHHKTVADERMELAFAAPLEDDFLRELQGEQHALREWELNLTFLSKFGGTLTPADMRTDLVFKRAADDDVYLQKEFRW